MAFNKDNLNDYVEVKDRIQEFYEKYPEGSIQSEIVELTALRVTIKAMAFREPKDYRPGIGHSYMNIPGTTPYTKGSEIENAETSAWGRAIAALGIAVKKSVASADEVAAKKEEPAREAVVGAPSATEGPPAKRQPAPATDKQKKLIRARARERGVETDEQLKAFMIFVTGKYSSTQLTMDDVDVILSRLDDEELVRDVVEARIGEKVAQP